MEEVLATHADVAECAVIGVPDELRGEVPFGFVVLKAGVDRPDDEIVRELVQLVREQVGAVAVFRDARVVARLPKTRSGKILRGTMRAIAVGQRVRRALHDRRSGHPGGDRSRPVLTVHAARDARFSIVLRHLQRMPNIRNKKQCARRGPAAPIQPGRAERWQDDSRISSKT